MHEYVSTMVSRPKVIATLALIAVVTSIVIGILIREYASPLPPYFAPPGVLTIFGLVFWVYDRILWRIEVLGHRLSPIPDLGGTWEGTIDIRSSEAVAELKCTVQVTQSWSRISITFETDFTRSASIMASLGPKEESSGGLRYEYDVTPKPGVEGPEANVPRHFGMARLLPIHEDWDDLTGEFFNDRSFQRWGIYRMNKVLSARGEEVLPKA